MKPLPEGWTQERIERHHAWTRETAQLLVAGLNRAVRLEAEERAKLAAEALLKRLGQPLR